MDRDIIEIVGIDSLVPQEHLLRRIDAAVDFSKLYEMVEPLYCEDNGRPSIDPVVLFKMVLIQHVYGLPSLRRTAEEVSGSIYYRWFLGYSLQEEIPVVSKHYAEELMAEVNADREAHGKKPFDDDDEQPPKGGKKPRDNTSKKKLARRKKEKAHTVTKSITDPDCGLFVKGDHKRQFAYEAHTACDKRGFILEAVVTPGNVHDKLFYFLHIFIDKLSHVSFSLDVSQQFIYAMRKSCTQKHINVRRLELFPKICNNACCCAGDRIQYF